MSFKILIFNIVSLILLDVQVNATYDQAQLLCSKNAFVTFFEYLNGVLQNNGKEVVQYMVQINDWTRFDDWSCGILKDFNMKLKCVPARAGLKDEIEAQSGTLQLALLGCNVAIYDTSTKSLVDEIMSTLGSSTGKFGKSGQNSGMHRLFSRTTHQG